MKEVSIEYSHIYTNEKIGKEQELSLKILAKLDERNKSLVVLVDDYSFPDPTFDYEKFSEWLGQNGYKPDVVMRESQLMPQCDEVLSLIQDNGIKDQITFYIQAKKYPCSLFIASWYLLRLGKINHQNFPKEQQTRRLVNILPENFKPFEDKGLEIIKNTEFSSLVDKIENHYFEGRLIV